MWLPTAPPFARVAVHPDWLRPAWAGREPRGIGAVMTTRAGGAGQGPYASLNLRHGIGDDPAAVVANQARFAAAIGATPVWLDQVHGSRVLRLTAEDVAAPHVLPPADASVTTDAGIACSVQVADCLPVLFAAKDGRAVGAAHAGWRGLAAGVLEATLAAVCDAARCPPREVSAWLGACIGPGRFEVGDAVRRAFGGGPASAVPGASAPERASAPASEPAPVPASEPASASACFRPHTPGKWLADLPMIARHRLQSAGVADVSGGGWCTVDDASRFFSFRRDKVTGRMAAAIWIQAGR